MNVKFCGLSTADEFETAEDVGATHAGVVVQAPDSHRNLDLEEAADLVSGAPSALTTVLVTPTDDADEAREALDEVSADVLQASGELSPEELVEVAEEAGVDAWKAIGLADDAAKTVERIDSYADAGADAVVLDAITEGYGGSGETIDWGHAGQVRRSIAIDLVLAGGLTPANVAEAILEVDPECVDVSSGIETDERKDPDKMKAFMGAVRAEVDEG